ncbi:MAG: hypothetical protein K0S39_2677 [Paenibacillus sp.]|nr:hypothetical protein [Paenibacillus sp.]
MRNINLLPRKPYVEKAFIPLLVLTVSIFLLMTVLLVFSVYSSDTTTNKKTAQIAEMQQRIQRLNAVRQVDQTTLDYTKFNEELRKVKETRRYWVPVFELLSNNVPPTARIVNMGVEEQEKMSLNMEFADLTQIANFMTLLQKASLFDNVTVISIEKVQKKLITENDKQPEKSLTDPSNGLGNDTFNPNNKRTESTERELTKEEYLQMVEKQSIVPTTQSDELLNEINWIINQQASKQQLNIELPEKSFSTPIDDNALPKTNPFSKQEMDNARKKLDELKKTKIVSKDQSQPKVDEVIPDIIIYQVSFELKLKNLNQVK